MSAFAISKFIIWPVLKLFIKRIDGVKNIPDKPCVIVCNHGSLIDAGLIIFMLAWYKNKRVRSIAIKTAFTGLFWDMLFKWAGAIRVNGSVEKAIKALKKGDFVVVFPEGGRTYTGKIGRAKGTGAGIMALRANVPVLPIAMNTFEFWNRYQKLPNFKKIIKIKIGEAKYYKLKTTKTNARRVVKDAMKEVKKLKCTIS